MHTQTTSIKNRKDYELISVDSLAGFVYLGGKFAFLFVTSNQLL